MYISACIKFTALPLTEVSCMVESSSSAEEHCPKEVCNVGAVSAVGLMVFQSMAPCTRKEVGKRN